jgi:ABC-2 type transport system ATP-binding protein
VTPAVLIEANCLRKTYDGRAALDNVSFRVKAGEIVGLLGPNGAGKTTAISILATLITPDSGEVRIANIDSRAAPARIRQKLGFVPQTIAIYPSLSSSQNLEIFSRIHGLASYEAKKQSLEALETVGLSDRADDPVWKLSGGMKRRLNLACGIVHRPEVLLLDEPTVGVDPQSRENVFAVIRQLADSGVAVLYSSHYMEEVERLCHRALLIDRGRLIAEGTIPALIELGGQHLRIEITFETLPRPGWYDEVPDVKELTDIVSGNRMCLLLGNLKQVSELLNRAERAGGQLRDFLVYSPNLSDAFIALTGHALHQSIIGT